MIIDLRPSTPADDEFCYGLHQAALGEHVAAIWGWEDEAQREYHRGAFAPGQWMIITADGVDVGMIDIDRRADEIYLGRIELLPDHQGRGVGTKLIGELLEEADRAGHPLILDVLAVNTRAYALYHRLGFEEVGRHGDGGIKIRMRYPAGG
jgi:ribosomal protein S18 acetylase RimI-like enzyme